MTLNNHTASLWGDTCLPAVSYYYYYQYYEDYILPLNPTHCEWFEHERLEFFSPLLVKQTVKRGLRAVQAPFSIRNLLKKVMVIRGPATLFQQPTVCVCVSGRVGDSLCQSGSSRQISNY